MQTPRITEDVVFGVDFEDYGIGSQNAINLATGLSMIRRTTAANPGDGVIEHPEHGRCFEFTGKSWFTLPETPQFSNFDYQLDIEFAPKTKSVGSIFSTGSFPSGGIQRGTLIGHAADPNYVTISVYGASSNYRISNTGGVNTLKMEKIRVVQVNRVITVTNLTRNTSQTFGAFTVPDDTYCCLGGALNHGTFYSQFIGYMKSLRITRL